MSFNSAPANPNQEWRQTSAKSFEREVSGGEKMFDFLERNNNGHGEGCMSVTCSIKGDFSREHMMNRFKNGFLQEYIRHPLIGCSLETELRDPNGPNEEANKVTYLRYRQPSTEEEARQLVDTHIVEVGLRDVSELPHYVLNRRIGEGDGRRGTMYVALSQDMRTVSMAYHLSHIVYDPFYGARAFNDLLTFIAMARADAVDYSLATVPVSSAEMQKRLPVSLAFSYQEQCSPTDEDVQTGIDHWTNLLMESSQKDSILIPSDGDASFRKHNRRIAKSTINAKETQRVMEFCKSIGIPLVCVMGACYLHVLAHEYAPANKEDMPEGIKVTIPLPVQQWLDVNPTEEHGPTSCALMAGLVWVPIRDASILEIAVSLGTAIQAQMADGPHALGREAQDALLLPYLSGVASSSSVYLPPGFPGLTFVGNVARVISRYFKKTSFELTVDDVYMGTRTMTNRPWMLGSIWNGCFSCETYFDEKYLDRSRMERIVAKTMGNLISLLPEVENERQSRL